jgi:hypothetical protein
MMALKSAIILQIEILYNSLPTKRTSRLNFLQYSETYDLPIIRYCHLHRHRFH